jgi:hypothetical protein
MTPYYITGSFFLASLLAFLLGRHTANLEIEDYFNELEERKTKMKATSLQGDDLR